MNDFGVLNNRKRALIALIHSLVFLGIAIHGFASPKAGVLLRGSGETGDFVLIGIYLTVASILAWLVSLARCAKERMYFGLCTGSATFGLLRTIFGDASFARRPVPARDHVDLCSGRRHLDSSFLLASCR